MATTQIMDWWMRHHGWKTPSHPFPKLIWILRSSSVKHSLTGRSLNWLSVTAGLCRSTTPRMSKARRIATHSSLSHRGYRCLLFQRCKKHNKFHNWLIQMHSTLISSTLSTCNRAIVSRSVTKMTGLHWPTTSPMAPSNQTITRIASCPPRRLPSRPSNS